MRTIVTKSALETKKFAAHLAHSVGSPKVIALEGDLGAGKTTFTQGFARALGIKEKIQSPTFVLLKIYKVRKGAAKHLAHIDCYRLDSSRELAHLGFKDLLRDKNAIILIEWADRIKNSLPKSTIRIKFRHGEKPTSRVIEISRNSWRLVEICCN